MKRRASVSEKRQSRDDLSVISPTSKDHPILFFNDSIDVGAETQEKIPRNLSFDSLQRAVKKSMANLRQPDLPKSELDSGQRLHRSVVGVTTLEAHPTLNYCKIFSSFLTLFAMHFIKTKCDQDLAGMSESPSFESVVKLYQFGQKRELVTYSTAGSSGSITRCRFDPYGTRFGACDMKGDLRLWKFDASQDSLRPSIKLNCHSAVANDFVFLNSSTLLATAGVSNNGRYVMHIFYQ